MIEGNLLLTDDDMAKMFCVSSTTIRNWKMTNKIPEEAIFKLPGSKKGTVRYIRTKIEDWVNGNLQAQ